MVRSCLTVDVVGFVTQAVRLLRLFPACDLPDPLVGVLFVYGSTVAESNRVVLCRVVETESHFFFFFSYDGREPHVGSSPFGFDFDLSENMC